MRRWVVATPTRRLLVRLLIVLAIVPTALIAPAPPVWAAPPAVPLSYTSAANAPVGIDPQGIAVADVNGDSKQDLAVANCFNDSVSVLLGTGTGAFTPAPGSPITVGTCPEAVVLVDLNGDNKQDLVAANYNDGTVSVFLGNGDGTFTPKTGSPFAAGSTPNDLAVGDVTGDGKKDIVVTNTTVNTVSVLAGNGLGGFGAPTTIATGSQPLGVALGDVDGAHGLDILVANSGGNTVSVLLNNGSGVFSARRRLRSGRALSSSHWASSMRTTPSISSSPTSTTAASAVLPRQWHRRLHAGHWLADHHPGHEHQSEP